MVQLIIFCLKFEIDSKQLIDIKIIFEFFSIFLNESDNNFSSISLQIYYFVFVASPYLIVEN